MRYKFTIWQHRTNIILTVLFICSCIAWLCLADSNLSEKLTSRLEPMTVLFGGLAGLSTLIWFEPKYRNLRVQGRQSFNYSSNEGLFTIGKDDQLFTTTWSKGDSSTIWLYNDHKTIEKIAIAKNVYSFKEIKNADSFDFSSRAITLQENQIAVIKNTTGYYALIKIVDVKDDTREDERDELTIEWIINPAKELDFS